MISREELEELVKVSTALIAGEKMIEDLNNRSVPYEITLDFEGQRGAKINNKLLLEGMREDIMELLRLRVEDYKDILNKNITIDNDFLNGFNE